jgi:hypothetical protein
MLSSIAESAKDTFDFGARTLLPESKIKLIGEQINDKSFTDDEKGPSLLEKLREKIKHFKERTMLGMLWIQLMLFVSVLSAIVYIYTTYTTLDNNKGESINGVFFILELILGGLFVIDWTMSFFGAENKLSFLKRLVIQYSVLISLVNFATNSAICCIPLHQSFYCWVDLLTVVPVFTTFNITCPDYESISSAKDGLYYVLCCLTCSRILRSLRFCTRFEAIEDEVQRFLANMSLKLVVMILFSKFCFVFFFYFSCLFFLLFAPNTPSSLTLRFSSNAVLGGSNTAVAVSYMLVAFHKDSQ